MEGSDGAGANGAGAVLRKLATAWIPRDIIGIDMLVERELTVEPAAGR